MCEIAVVRPESDNAENALSEWAGLVLAGVSGASHIRSITDLRGSSVTQPAVETLLERNDVTLYFGHGEEDQLGRFGNLLVDSHNICKAAGRVLISLACKTAVSLGPDSVCISNGVRAYLGFDDDLVVYLGTPSLFGLVVEVAIIPFLLSGSPIADVHDDLISGFQDLEEFYVDPNRGGTDPDANIIWMAAHINWRGIRLFGDDSATVS